MADLSVGDYVAAIHREGQLMAAAVGRGDLDATVPTCPAWTLRELAHHLGRVHHWAAAHVEKHRSEPLSDEESEAEWGEMPPDDEVVEWYRTANARLVKTLSAAPADLACWSFLPAKSPLTFWARRQSHETAIHRADAQVTAGAIDPVPADFAIDGIDELLTGFYGRPGRRLRSEKPYTFGVRTAGASWLVHIGPDGPRAERSEGEGEADCTVSGDPSVLYFALWNRGALTDLDVTGDDAVLDLWAQKATVRWS
jgi:uncharacterized protein (TIGR03083 family)